MLQALNLWQAAGLGYVLTVALETPVLLLGLAPQHPWRRRLAAAVWLNACSYPVVSLVLPLCVPPAAYLWVAETFAPVSECLLFWAAFSPEAGRRDVLAIAAANLVSFVVGYAIVH